MKNQGLTLEVVYTDPDLMEVFISVASSTFSGATSLYAVESQLADAAGLIAGFPTGRGDAREVRLGAPGRGWAGGSLSLRFICVDSAGHSFVDATIEAEDDVSGIRQRATIAVPLEAAAVDNFVQELRIVATARKGRAFLRGVRGTINGRS